MDAAMSTETGTGTEIAVIGMAGRFPGAANIDEFWENLENGVESVSFFSDAELEEAGVEPSLSGAPDYVKANSLMERIEFFDSDFFGFNPSEADIMDPQLRIFHECAWTALEDAGYCPDIYDGLIGLFAGAGANFSWEARVQLSGKADILGRYAAFQLTNKDFLSLWVSYKLNLRGPAVIVQTACSTSLVAVHMACQELLSGGCDMALAGGVGIMHYSKAGYLYREGMIISPDGHNRTFDAKAKGTVSGNGVAVVVLKPLEDAIASDDHIYAVVRGTAVNNDGCRKVGFSAPSVEGQAEVIVAAQVMAEVKPGDISYIEAHGTATELGDPVEVRALKLAFDTVEKGSCALGSVKTNIGHLDAAAGAAGFIKTVLALKHRRIPPSLHFENPNPNIDFENSPFYVNTELCEWKNKNRPLLAGVSSFGIGGTNAHVVLEEWVEDGKRETENDRYRLILLSARTKTALDKMTENMARYLEKHPGIDLGDVAYTLQVGRRAFDHRRMLVCGGSDLKGVVEHLSAPGSENVRTFVTREKDRPTAFMFPGQGAQYINMGLGLYKTEPLFRREMDRCFKILADLMGGDIKSMVYPPAPGGENGVDITRTEIAQPVIFTFEYALAGLLMDRGIKPYAMIGHSIGEYTAACLSGVFSLEDALDLVVSRGRAMQGTPPGSMMSVSMSELALKPLLPPRIALAAVNSPSQCVVSGPGETVTAFSLQLRDKGVRTRMLHTSHAFHSAMMDPILEKFKEKVKQIKLNEPGIPFISGLTGTWITNREAVDPAYWVDHLRYTVRFADGIKEMMGTGILAYLEVGPGNVLSTFARQADRGEAKPLVVNLTRHPRAEIADECCFLDKIGRLWLHGISIDWEGFYRGEKRGRIPLPTYPFEGTRYRVDGLLPDLGTAALAETALKPPVPGTDGAKGDAAVSGAPGLMERPPGITTTYVAPRDEIEEELVDTWQHFFGFSPVGIHDDFFELGGDSLKAMGILSNIGKRMNADIPLTDFFRLPTVAKLAGYYTRRGESVSGGRESGGTRIRPTEKKEYYPLSGPQRRFYILQKLDPENTGFNISEAFTCEGTPDMEALEKIFEKLVNRHESFRTYFIQVGGNPVQRIHPHLDFEMEYYESEETLTGRFVRPFDLSRAPLLRVGITKAGEDLYLMAIDVHHIVSDGLSQGLLMKEFLGLLEGVEPAPLSIQYKDFSEWQNSERGKAEMKRQEEYWLNVLNKVVSSPDLPTDYPRDGVQRFEGDFMEFEIGLRETLKLKKMAADRGTTLYIVLLAVCNIWLAKICAAETVVIGSGIGGRGNPDLQNVVGSLQNMIALINRARGEQTFTEFLECVKETALGAFENQDYPFDDLVATAAVPREPGRGPLFDFFYILNNVEPSSADRRESAIPALRFNPCPYRAFHKGRVRFDLALYGCDNGRTVTFIMEYGTTLFKSETIVQLADYYKEILAAVLEQENVFLKDIVISPGLGVGKDRYTPGDYLEFAF